MEKSSLKFSYHTQNQNHYDDSRTQQIIVSGIILELCYFNNVNDHQSFTF